MLLSGRISDAGLTRAAQALSLGNALPGGSVVPGFPPGGGAGVGVVPRVVVGVGDDEGDVVPVPVAVGVRVPVAVVVGVPEVLLVPGSNVVGVTP